MSPSVSLQNVRPRTLCLGCFKRIEAPKGTAIVKHPFGFQNLDVPDDSGSALASMLKSYLSVLASVWLCFFELRLVVKALCILACALLPLIWWSWSDFTESKERQKTSLPVANKSSQGTCWVMGSKGVKALGLFGVNKGVVAVPSCWIWVSEYLRCRLYVWCNACQVSRMFKCQRYSKGQMTTETNETSLVSKLQVPRCNWHRPCGLMRAMWYVDSVDGGGSCFAHLQRSSGSVHLRVVTSYYWLLLLLITCCKAAQGCSFFFRSFPAKPP